MHGFHCFSSVPYGSLLYYFIPRKVIAENNLSAKLVLLYEIAVQVMSPIRSAKELSIVIPVFNSAECIHELVAQISGVLRRHKYEIVLVNDQSGDSSWKEMQSVAQRNKNVIAVNLRKNAGQDNALMAGFSFASGRFVVVMDDDLQHSPKDIPALHKEIQKGFDVCYAKFHEKKQRWWKNLGSYINGKISEVVISKPGHIYLSPFKIIRREVVDDILKYQGIFPYVDGLIFQVTNSVTQITVEHHDRYRGRSNYSLIRSIRVLIKLVTGFSIRPLRISSLAGFVTALAGFLLGIYHIVKYFTSDDIVEGWTTQIVLTLFLGGLILMSLGLVGEYIGRIYLCVNAKPQFSIKDVLNGSSRKNKTAR
jgi:polyisoprenyl-phosphate glycosyltransferase